MAAGQGFASMPESQRQLVSAVGSLRRWSRVNSAEARRAELAPANAARRARWEREADPDGVLSPEELEAAVARLQRAHMKQMALASARKRAAA